MTIPAETSNQKVKKQARSQVLGICVGCVDMICFVSGDNVCLGWCNHTDIFHLAKKMKEESGFCVFESIYNVWWIW